MTGKRAGERRAVVARVRQLRLEAEIVPHRAFEQAPLLLREDVGRVEGPVRDAREPRGRPRSSGSARRVSLSHPASSYQIWQLSLRTIAVPAAQWNAARNSGMFDSVPMTRSRGFGCGSVSARLTDRGVGLRAAPHLRVREEEALLGRVAVDHLVRLRLRACVSNALYAIVRPPRSAIASPCRFTPFACTPGSGSSELYSSTMHCARFLNAAASAGVHQSLRSPLRVEETALVVEAVRHLVADHGADRAVVHRVVGVRVEERRLQDAGREDDLVVRGVVVGVHRRRRHAELRAVRRRADARDVRVCSGTRARP